MMVRFISLISRHSKNMDPLKYPSADRVIEYNALALAVIQVKKKDRPQVLNKTAIIHVIKDCTDLRGDVYDKAVVLLVGLVKKHPFSSGNRRTAMIVAKDFLESNKSRLGVSDDPSQARALLGVREGFYSTEEIKEWLKHGKICEFKKMKLQD